jgi:hypothetical protein
MTILGSTNAGIVDFFFMKETHWGSVCLVGWLVGWLALAFDPVVTCRIVRKGFKNMQVVEGPHLPRYQPTRNHHLLLLLHNCRLARNKPHEQPYTFIPCYYRTMDIGVEIMAVHISYCPDSLWHGTFWENQPTFLEMMMNRSSH